MKRGILSFLAASAFGFMVCGCGDKPVKGVQAFSPPSQTSDPNRVSLPPGSPALKQIHTALVGTREIPKDLLTAPGKVEVNPNRISRLVMPVPGRVRSVLVKLGDAVTQGQPLFTVESPEVNAALSAYSQADAHLRQATSAQGKAEKDLARFKDLYDYRAAALKDVTNAENDLVQAQAAVEQSRAEVEEARERLALLGLEPGAQVREVTVSAPIAGKVMEIAVVPGEYRNDTAASLMTIADLSTVWITSSVPESSIRLINVGEPVLISLAAFPNESFRGRVTRIADTVDPDTRTVKVQAELANPDGRFRPEMFGSIIHSHGSRLLPVLPATAVVQSGQGPTVYLETSTGVFERTKVVVEDARDGVVPVLGGLRGGERVVVDGGVLLGTEEAHEP
jgi:cobalt-zinc-cadmium efflux system membrane fusion protein